MSGLSFCGITSWCMGRQPGSGASARRGIRRQFPSVGMLRRPVPSRESPAQQPRTSFTRRIAPASRPIGGFVPRPCLLPPHATSSLAALHVICSGFFEAGSNAGGRHLPPPRRARDRPGSDSDGILKLRSANSEPDALEAASMRSAGKPALISNLPETGHFLDMGRAEHAPMDCLPGSSRTCRRPPEQCRLPVCRARSLKSKQRPTGGRCRIHVRAFSVRRLP